MNIEFNHFTVTRALMQPRQIDRSRVRFVSVWLARFCPKQNGIQNNAKALLQTARALPVELHVEVSLAKVRIG